MTAHFLFLAAASLFSVETQDVTPVTTPGNSQVGIELKPPVPETPWTISDRSDFPTIVADSADDPAPFEHAREQGRVDSPLPQGPSPSHRDNDETPLPMTHRTWI